jgi:hypothetical protein
MFTEAQRAIFGPYPRGDGTSLHGDPIRIRRRLVHALEGDLNRWLAEYRCDIEPLAFAAAERLLAATVEAFDLIPFDPLSGVGASDDEVLGVLASFLAFEESKKKTASNSPTGVPPTDRGPSPIASTSRPGLASGSTDPGCGCG